MSTLRPAIYVETISRSFLLSLGFDHVVIEFFVSTAVGALALLLTLIFVGCRIPTRGQHSAIRKVLPRIPDHR